MENYIGKGVLVVVDFQYDFCNKKGSLYVKGAEKAKEAILNRIKNDEFINQVIFTMDWHNFYDNSFEVNGGQWPVHCVQNTVGAGVDNDLVNACIKRGIIPTFVYKGDKFDVEEYGAFSNVTVDGDLVTLKNVSDEAENEVTVHRLDAITVCGIAGDYCVKETLKNLYEKSPNNIFVFEDGIASIDGGKTLNEYVEEKHIMKDKVWEKVITKS